MRSDSEWNHHVSNLSTCTIFIDTSEVILHQFRVQREQLQQVLSEECSIVVYFFIISFTEKPNTIFFWIEKFDQERSCFCAKSTPLPILLFSWRRVEEIRSWKMWRYDFSDIQCGCSSETCAKKYEKRKLIIVNYPTNRCVYICSQAINIVLDR